MASTSLLLLLWRTLIGAILRYVGRGAVVFFVCFVFCVCGFFQYGKLIIIILMKKFHRRDSAVRLAWAVVFSFFFSFVCLFSPSMPSTSLLLLWRTFIDAILRFVELGAVFLFSVFTRYSKHIIIIIMKNFNRRDSAVRTSGLEPCFCFLVVVWFRIQDRIQDTLLSHSWEI